MNEYMMGYRWLHVDVEGDVQRGDAVRESAAGYVRHAGLTDVVDGVEGDVAGGFGVDATGDERHRRLHVVDGHVVEHQARDALCHDVWIVEEIDDGAGSARDR